MASPVLGVSSVLAPKGDTQWEGLLSHQLPPAPHTLTQPDRLHQGSKGCDQSPLKTGTVCIRV